MHGKFSNVIFDTLGAQSMHEINLVSRYFFNFELQSKIQKQTKQNKKLSALFNFNINFTFNPHEKHSSTLGFLLFVQSTKIYIATSDFLTSEVRSTKDTCLCKKLNFEGLIGCIKLCVSI